MRLSDLQNKDIVSVVEGKKIGKIIDVIIDEKGSMKSLVVQRVKVFNMFSNQGEIEVKWDQIKKIGEDVILVNV